MNNSEHQHPLADAPARLTVRDLALIKRKSKHLRDALQVVRQLSHGTSLLAYIHADNLEAEAEDKKNALPPAQRQGLEDVLQSSGEVVARLLAYVQDDLEKATMQLPDLDQLPEFYQTGGDA